MDKISKAYLISDTHFFHDRIIEFCYRPTNFAELIINQWKSTVHDEDIVYHLGDVLFGNQEQLSNILKALPGTKILIRGNHDRSHSNNWFIKAGFSAVLEKAQVGNILLSHMPSRLSEEDIQEGIINVHGHFHVAPPDRWEGRLKERITPNHFLLAIEKVKYKPVLLEEVGKKKYVMSSKDIIDGVVSISS